MWPDALLTGVFILSALPLLVVKLFPAPFYRVMDSMPFLVFHNCSEFFSVMVSLSIFGVAWFTYGQSGDRHALFLGSAFLAIGLMDFMHALAYSGMPDFITPNSPSKSSQFWVAARLFTAASFLGSAFVTPGNRTRWLSKPFLITAALAVSVVVLILIIFFPELVPTTFETDKGLTPFKKTSEYVVIFLLVLAFTAYRGQLSKTGDRLLIYYLAAFILCIFSELVFAVYKSVYDTFNILGHIYKVLAFYLIYRGVFVASVKNPYLKLLETEEKLGRDIAERLRTEKELVKAKEEWERTFDAITDPVMLLDTSQRISRVNLAMADKLAMKPAEAVGLTCYGIVHKTDGPPAYCPFRQMLEDGLPHSVEMREPLLGGFFITGASPLYDCEGKLTGGIHYLKDITERRLMEEELAGHRDHLEELVRQRTTQLREKGIELEKSRVALVNLVEDLNKKTEELEQANLKLKEIDRLKSMFIASMSHELRTPLNSIIGFSSILHDEWIGVVNAEQKENLAIILNSGRHLLNLINDVIDVSKIEAGKIEPLVEEFELSELIFEAAGLVRKEAEAKGLGLRVKSVNLRLKTDRRRLLQCLLNLLSNAAKFTDSGGLSIEAHAAGENMVDISVADTGIGIREEERGKLFQPFVRLVSPESANAPGTGLGLYLTRKLAVEILKGDLSMTSEFGKGSRFTLKIPAALP